MKTLLILLVIYDLENFARSHNGEAIVYKGFPKKVHPVHDYVKFVNTGAHYKKYAQKKSGRSFPEFEHPNTNERKVAEIAPDSPYFPLEFNGNLKSRVKKVPYFNGKDVLRRKRDANNSAPPATNQPTETTAKPTSQATEAPKPKASSPVAAANPKTVSNSRRSASKNSKSSAKSSKRSGKAPAPKKVQKLAKQSAAKKNPKRKPALRNSPQSSKKHRRGGKENENSKGAAKSYKNEKRPRGRRGGNTPAAKKGKAASKNKASNPKAVPSRRIIAARDARPEDYPYMVSIQKKGQHWCSGAILNPRLIITTANCFWKSRSTSRMKVRAGAHTVDHGGQVAYISEVMKHPKWSIRKNPDNDIALALLDRELKFSDAVHSVDLPNKVMMPPFEDAWVTSYGAERRDGIFSRLRQTLQVVYVRLMSDATCSNITSRFNVPLTDNFFCLQQAGRRAPCTRDTGAPAVSDGILWGLASWGIRKLCGTERFPAMFSYVASNDNMGFIINATSLLMSDERTSPFLDKVPSMRARAVSVVVVTVEPNVYE